MKKLNLFIIAVLLSTAVLAQAPQKMSYQAVIRNSSDAVNHKFNRWDENLICFKALHQATIVYVETHLPTIKSAMV